MTNKETATIFLKTIISGEIDQAFEKFVSPEFKHHNAYYPGDGKSIAEGMKENHGQFPEKIFEIQHVLEDGDLVAVHSKLQMKADMLPMAVLHLFRFKEGKIVELWDMGQPQPEKMVNENGMF